MVLLCPPPQLTMVNARTAISSVLQYFIKLSFIILPCLVVVLGSIRARHMPRNGDFNLLILLCLFICSFLKTLKIETFFSQIGVTFRRSMVTYVTYCVIVTMGTFTPCVRKKKGEFLGGWTVQVLFTVLFPALFSFLFFLIGLLF